VGEVVFNTALTGYQEILTDPSYCRQIVTLTYPHIGNVRCQRRGRRVHEGPCRRPDRQGPAAARVQLPRHATLPQYLQREGTVAIAGIDTRRLTRVLRSTGAQNGCIVSFAAGHAR
jgi:carbamoyl-phosphate synthase small subunit